jgi:mono/diheme cytochrome c family protein
MRNIKLAGAVTFVLAFGVLTGCGGSDDSDSTPADTNDTAATAPAPDTGSDAAVALFDSSGCAGCHTLSAADASGAVGPNLDTTTMTKDQIIAQIKAGGGPMPAYENQLSEGEIDSLATLISSQ